MKWRRFVSGMKLSKLFKGLLTLALIKLCLLAVIGWNTLAQPQGAPRPQVVAKAVQAVSPSPALAQATGGGATPSGQANAPATPGSAAPAPDAPTADASVGNAALQKRQEELDRRERELNTLEAKIKSDLAELEKRQAQMERMLEEAKMVRDKKDRHLVDVFSNMKSKQAAQVLATMDERQAVKILSGMRGRQAGEILTFVDPTKAARLAEALTQLQVPFE